ncbi:hypothetical protein ABZP36_024388 [Zizania latifolia]
MDSPAMRNPPLVLLVVVVVLLVSLRVRAGKIATEVVVPEFVASYLLFIDTYGVFLQSGGGAFQAVVYNPAGQQDRYYLAVLHAPSKSCVWTANRAAPITDRAAPLRLTERGISVEDPNGTVVWSTPAFSSPVAALRLEDSGNLALLDGKNRTLWQSFDRPTDSLVSPQRLAVGGFLASAASNSDFSEGDYRLDVTAADAVLTWMGSLYWRLSNDASSTKDRVGAVAFMAVNGTGLYLLAADDSVIIQAAMPLTELRIVKLGVDGKLQITSYASANASSPSSTEAGFVAPSGGCDLPLSCGALGLCTPRGNDSSCTCPPLFAASHDGGCAPSGSSTAMSAASCGGDGAAAPASYVSLGDGVAYYANKFSRPDKAGSNESSCQALCSGNCSCLGYFYDDSSLSCYLVQHQLGSLVNANTTRGGMLGFIKVQSSPSQGSPSSSSSNSTLIAILLPTIVAFILIVVVSSVIIVSWRKEKRRARKPTSRSRDVKLRRNRSPTSDSAHLVYGNDVDDGDDIVIPGLPTRFTHDEIEEITNSFRIKIGAGGFGAVYKGELPDGSAVAVKKIEGVGMQGKRDSSRGARSVYFPLIALEGHEAGQYAELADPRLEGRMVAGEVERVVKVALCCLHEDPQQRPSMAVVAGMLEGTMELWEPRVQSLRFLRLYGRGFSGPANGGDSGIMQALSGSIGDRSRSVTTTLTTMSGWPSYMSSSQLSGPR